MSKARNLSKFKPSVDGLVQSDDLIVGITIAGNADTATNADQLDGQHGSYYATALSVTTEISNRIAGDSATLSSANTYTDNKVAALVNTAPATLDTLNELAAALGNDANFSTTVTNSLAGKQATLVSGTNIKTVNGTSILGSGNIQIDGGVTSFNTRTGAVTLSSSDVTGALGYTPYNSTNPNGYITSSASIAGNAATATTLQNSRTINGIPFNGSANIDVTEWFHSDRNFSNGTLITTNINYAVTYGDPFVLEIRGNSYGNIIPLDLSYQGYIYNDTIINHGGLSNGQSISGLVAINNGGNLCFWFPNQGYWQGYNVKVYVPYATRAINRVTSITDVVKPTTSKQVDLSPNIRQSLHSGNYTSYIPASFPSGTAMLFAQTSAPTGWTKQTTHNDKALRVVSGTAGSGGSVAFSTAFASKTPSGSIGDTTVTGSVSVSGSVSGTTLGSGEIPSHRHYAINNANVTVLWPPPTNISSGNYVAGSGVNRGYENYVLTASGSDANVGLTSATGGSGSHSHGFSGSGSMSTNAHSHTFAGNAIDLTVQYVDVIIATKD